MVTVKRSNYWSSSGKRCGFLYNVVPTTVEGIAKIDKSEILSKETEEEFRFRTSASKNFKISNHGRGTRSALALYFISSDCSEWYTTVPYSPYFYISVIRKDAIDAVIQFLYNKFQNDSIGPVVLESCDKIDLSLPNHLESFNRTDGKSVHDMRNLIKLSFNNIDQLEHARGIIINLKTRVNGEKQSHGENFDEYYDKTDSFISNMQEIPDNYSLKQYEEDMLLGFKGHMRSYSTISNGDDAHIVDHAAAYIGDIYEHDVKYVNRVCIDLSIRCGTWYEVERLGCSIKLFPLERMTIAPLNIFAWDIECYKAPLKFPDVEFDEIILISIMFNGQGYLIVNRCVIANDIDEFSYNPCEDMTGTGCFKVYNEVTERDLLYRFFHLICCLNPHILVTYNGDNFDFPYVHRRAEINGISMEEMTGIYRSSSGIFSGQTMLNMDCYKWVERDSYLPFGSRTLKQVCKIKLRYNPVEIDAEDMIPLARSYPQKLAVYSVSDAVATYLLYIRFIHNFVFALSYIVPLPPNDVLRQGTGTLCENLLMAEAYANNILFPNKYSQKGIRYYYDPDTEKQHLIYENSYIGGHVESLKCGIFRDNLIERFELCSRTYQKLIDNLEDTLLYWADSNLSKEPKEPSLSGQDETVCYFPQAVTSVNGSPAIPLPSERLRRRFCQFVNFDDVYMDIYRRLCKLRDEPSIQAFPCIYHLDVSAMYPNIIISQRLQPTAIVTESFCQMCTYYKEASLCQKKMHWKQKLEISPIDKSHILPLMQDLKSRVYKSTVVQYTKPIKTNYNASDSETDGSEMSEKDKIVKTWNELTDKEREAELQKLVKGYSQKVFKKTKLNKEVDVESIVCQRENPFYVKTVLKFRDRRYVYKRLKKEGENELKALLKMKNGDYIKINEAKDKILINDSLQLAHKCILNSFYGYVKRGGSRWYSMEMGAIVTSVGAAIIESARKLIDSIGTPIELDTDGIWCMLPDIFPAVLDLRYKPDKHKPDWPLKTIELEYMTAVLNNTVAKEWTNEQYLELEDCGTYRTIKRNEIVFELDGPWHAMFLPASDKSEDLLKKRYVVYNHQKQIVELKGFEVKRRGEMRMIQLFQEEVFPQYLMGETKEEAYQSAARIALNYRRTLENKASEISEDDMFELLLAKKTVKKPVAKTPLHKCFGVTAARRLAELFKNDTYLNDGNITLSFLLSAYPLDAPRTARALPIQAFKVDNALRTQLLSKWLKVQHCVVNSSSRDILDWDYYKEKLDTQILKLICIPAIIQGIESPVPQLQLPNWLKNRRISSNRGQRQITSYFLKESTENAEHTADKLQNMSTKVASSNANLENVIVPVKEISWLQELKKKWLIMAKDFRKYYRNIQQHIKSSVYLQLKNKMANNTYNGLDFYDMHMLFSEVWHICNVRFDEEDPGTLNCVVSIYDKPIFLDVKVELWRKIYVNSVTQLDIKADENVSVRNIKEQYVLPRGATQRNLTELEMKERYFLENFRNSLNHIFDKNVCAVYETQLPIFFDFTVRSGNAVTVGTDNVSTALNEKLEFRSNVLRATTSFQSVDLKYMVDVDIIFVHIFHGINKETKRCNRLFAGVYSKGERVANKIFVASMHKPTQNVQGSFKIIKESVLQKYREKWKQHQGLESDSHTKLEVFPDCFGTFYDPDFELSAMPTVAFKSSLKKLDMFLLGLSPCISRRKCIVYLHSTLDKSELGEWSKGFHYPVYFAPSVECEHRQIVTNRFLRECFDESMNILYQKSLFIEEKIMLSQISSIPFGILLPMSNVETHKCIFDIMYARALRSSSTILWGRCEPGPDLGSSHFSSSIYSDYDILTDESNLKVSFPGVFRGYGAKISFNQSIMYNAIVFGSKSSENAENYENGSGISNPYVNDEPQLDTRVLYVSSFHPLAFKTLGNMLENLMKLMNILFQKVEFEKFKNINMCNFLRSWLSDSKSVLFDAALYSMVLACTQKYLAMLLHHLGFVYKLRVVYADSTFVVVDSNMMSVTKGRNKIYKAFESLASNQSKFKDVPFCLEEEYIAMVQLTSDCFVRYKNYVDASKSNCSENFKALEYLPSSVEMFIRYFLKAVALDPLWQTLRLFYESEGIKDNLAVGTSEPLELINTDCAELRKSMERHVIYNWFQPGICFRKLYDILSDSKKFLSSFGGGDSLSLLSFPMLPGSTVYGSNNWRLETVKLLTYILKVDKAIDWEDISQSSSFDEKRHELFMLTGESEYTAGDWKAPMRRLELNSVTCKNCQMGFNVDIVSALICSEDVYGAVSCHWLCNVCGHNLDHKQLEMKIIEHLEDVFYAYQAQDFVCSECKSIKHMYRRSFCRCGKNYIPQLPNTQWEDCLQVASEISKLANMKNLQECITVFNDIMLQ